MGHGLLRWTLQPNITPVARLLAYVTGLVNQELLLKNEYLVAENRILRSHLYCFLVVVIEPPLVNDSVEF